MTRPSPGFEYHDKNRRPLVNKCGDRVLGKAIPDIGQLAQFDLFADELFEPLAK